MNIVMIKFKAWFGLVGWFLNVLDSNKAISRTGPKTYV